MKKPAAKRGHPPLVLGWREWVSLPELSGRRIKAKLDTGARSSSLHVANVSVFRRHGESWVTFQVVDSSLPSPPVQTRVIDERIIRSSAGHEETRVVIRTELEIAGWRWPIDVTLANRPAMSFRMLLGRQALTRHAIVDPSHSYLAGLPAGKPR
jgi:hypothetical protein